MTDYTGKELQKINPCGIENKPATYCQYVKECTELGRTSGKFVCLSKMGYQVAQYLLEGSDAETERKELKGLIRDSVNRTIVDPKQESWTPTKLKSSDIGNITDEIISRGQEFYQRASTIGSSKNPLNIDCSVEDIVNDL